MVFKPMATMAMVAATGQPAAAMMLEVAVAMASWLVCAAMARAKELGAAVIAFAEIAVAKAALVEVMPRFERECSSFCRARCTFMRAVFGDAPICFPMVW